VGAAVDGTRIGEAEGEGEVVVVVAAAAVEVEAGEDGEVEAVGTMKDEGVLVEVDINFGDIIYHLSFSKRNISGLHASSPLIHVCTICPRTCKRQSENM